MAHNQAIQLAGHNACRPDGFPRDPLVIYEVDQVLISSGSGPTETRTKWRGQGIDLLSRPVMSRSGGVEGEQAGELVDPVR